MKKLAVVLGLALAVGVSSLAFAETVHTIKAKIAPTKQPKVRYGPATFDFTTASECRGPSCSGVGAVKPANRVQIYIDHDVKLDTKGLATCRKSQLENTTTEEAKAKCGKAMVGSGKAIALIGGNPDAPVETVGTTFNGVPKGGKPVLLVHARTPSLGFTTVLEGVYKPQRGAYGLLLDVHVPELPLQTALVSFQNKIHKLFRVRGKTHSYISARCHDSNRTWNFKGTDSYQGGGSLTATVTQKCTVAR